MTFHRTGDLVLCPFTSSWALGWFPPPGSWEQCTPFSLCLSGSSSISVSVLKLDRGHSAPCGSPSGGFPLLCGGLALRPCSTSALGPSPALRPPTVLLLGCSAAGGLGYHEHLLLWRPPAITVFIFSWKCTVPARLEAP